MNNLTYQFKIKSRKTGKPIKHELNRDGVGFYSPTKPTLFTDERMKAIALGILLALQEQDIFVEIWKRNKQGLYDLIYTRY